MSTATIIANLKKNNSEWLRIALDHYRGHDLLDLRVCVPLNDLTSAPTPTKKGVSINVKMLPELIRTLRAAEAEARKRGLIGGGAD